MGMNVFFKYAPISACARYVFDVQVMLLEKAANRRRSETCSFSGRSTL